MALRRTRRSCVVASWLVAGLLVLGVSLADVHGSSPSSEEPDAAAKTSSNREGRFTERAKRLLEEAKARLEAKQREQAEQERASRRAEAQKLAIQMAREKAKDLQAKERQAAQQVRAARERQLKALYQKGLAYYRQGRYQEAIRFFQQMVVLDPAHPLVKSAERLITRADLKQFEQRARARAELPSGMREGAVPELSRLLAEKRIEQEASIKYARIAMRDQEYDRAIELLYRILNQDPDHRLARELLEQAQTAKLNREDDDLERQVAIDERRMMNDVLKAELLNPNWPGPPPASETSPRLLNKPPEPSQRLDPKLAEPISFDFQDVALGDVIDFLADAANVSIIPSPRLDLKTQRVSLRVDQLPLELALKYLMKTHGLTHRVEEGIILIARPEEFAREPLETRVFFLRTGFSPSVLETAAIKPNPAFKTDSLKTLIEQSLTQPSGSRLVIDERSGSLIVTNTAENLRRVEGLLRQLDVAPVQVLIETRFVEVVLSELGQLGLESVLTGSAALTKKGARDGTQGPGHQIAKSGGTKFPALSREDEGLNFTLQGILSGTQFESVLHLLEESQKSKTLSAPRVTTLNNQTASIKVVDEFRYPTRYEVSLVQFDVNGDGDFDDAGETEFVNVPKDIQKRDVGILLSVTPSVGKDLKAITLVLSPEVSSFSQFRDLGGGVTVPEFTSSQLATSVVIEDGQTVVLGGLMKDTDSMQITKVPLLGDIPLVGILFRQREESQTRKNLLIFVTARILAPQRPTT